MKTQFTKALDIRSHKRDWLDIASLRKKRESFERFSSHVLSHPTRLTVERCYVCGSGESSAFGETYGIPYLECVQCTHVYAQYVIGREWLEEYYREEYFDNSVYVDRSQVQTRNQALLEPKLTFVVPFVTSPLRRWLDVGTGNGGVVSCARRMGFDAHGIELGTPGIAFAKEVFGLELGNHTLDKELALRGPKSYDIVSFFMVLEHVTDPVEQVRLARELLTDRGVLVVEVPKADSVAAMGDVAFPNHGLRQLVGSHIMNYTMKSLTHLLERGGFEIEGAWHIGQDVFNLVIHLALLDPSFLDSKLCAFFLDHNNVLQEAIDRQQLSDEVIVVARKS